MGPIRFWKLWLVYCAVRVKAWPRLPMPERSGARNVVSFWGREFVLTIIMTEELVDELSECVDGNGEWKSES